MFKQEDFQPQTIVRNTETGVVGVVCPDLSGVLSCNGQDDVSVVYEGTTYSSSTDFHLLEIVGPENAVANLDKCGSGKGEETCIFLTFTDGAFNCQRFGPLRSTLVFRQMKAKRNPEKLFPKCQIF